MRKRLLAKLWALAMLASLVLCASASAANDGRGFYGETDDKVVTNAGFILIIAFPTFVFVASRIQAHLEKRKAARKAAEKSQAGDAFLGGGW
jgi:hypothetical protein